MCQTGPPGTQNVDEQADDDHVDVGFLGRKGSCA